MSTPPTLTDLIVRQSASIRQALECIDDNAQGICFVTDPDGQLVGVATDGDIRRGLLSGSELDDTISTVMQTDFVSLPVSAEEETTQSRLSSRIRVIPLVDDDGRPVDYASRSKHRRIPIMEPNLGGNELAYVTECVETNWISSQGRFVEEFEDAVAAYTDAPYALAVSNGTVALHLALETFGIGEGDEVIVPDLTFAASVNAILHAGATPVLVDVDEASWGLDPEVVVDAVTERTRAIMPVHLYGQPCDMDALTEIAWSHDLLVIEDAAEAIGSTYRGRKVGSIGDAGCFSFFGNKTITTGEGGMVLFQERDAYERAAQLRDHGMSLSRRYWHEQVGFNYRMTNLQAAIGKAQMERIDTIVGRKMEIAELYARQLCDVNVLTLPTEFDDRTNTHWLFTALLSEDASVDRDPLITKLKQNGIDFRPVFYPLHEMPIYEDYGHGSLQRATRIGHRGISFPSSVTLSDDTILEISQTFRSVLRTTETVAQSYSSTSVSDL
jgi:perosamine synthetase